MDGCFLSTSEHRENFITIEEGSVMIFLYNTGLLFFRLGISLAAVLGNKKARQWVRGRKNWKKKLQGFVKKSGPTYWMHCSSLGEFEQGRPVLEALRSEDSTANIVLSFFSPSGYEVRKNYPGADLLTYLPLDGYFTSKKFIKIINPDKVLFVKYDYWHYYLAELKKQNIPVFIVSGIFRKGQHFFSWYGGFFRRILKNVTHFFIQDEPSGELLNSIGIQSYTITGDTRFDRVIENSRKNNSNSILERFKGDSTLLICGSTWPDDEKILIDSFQRLENQNLKLLIAPHEVNEGRIKELIKIAITKSGTSEVKRYSKSTDSDMQSCRILIMDTIGQLASAYAHGDIAYIGGGFNKGIHNTLEAAAYNLPVIFGPRHEKFLEANALIQKGAAFCTHSKDELALILHTLLKQPSFMKGAGKASGEYVRTNGGATLKIMQELRKFSAM